MICCLCLAVNEYGFGHHVSPVKKSKNKHEWCYYHLQTPPSKTNSVVGFNLPCHESLKHCEESNAPVLLMNLKNDVLSKWKESDVHEYHCIMETFLNFKNLKPSFTALCINYTFTNWKVMYLNSVLLSFMFELYVWNLRREVHIVKVQY